MCMETSYWLRWLEETICSPWFTRIWSVIFVVSSSFKVWNPAWAWGTFVLRRHVVVQNVEGCDWSSCCRCYPLVSSELLVWTLAKRNGALTGMPCLRKLWVSYFCCNGISCAIKMRKFHRCFFVFFRTIFIIDSWLCSSLMFLLLLYFSFQFISLCLFVASSFESGDILSIQGQAIVVL